LIRLDEKVKNDPAVTALIAREAEESKVPEKAAP
jgi:hypothetical protein